ncbi:response regulator [Spirosoma pollinicola]|uniref:Uncharacterized protein n=1 Tax=Spirosoma pollinicola TaxID=2057025 RepID=A0A2K8ZB44_9BACT|nr:hypothetical protein [Spirosoma pollinicola]AUD07093.1 hypothetical protein CWM47_37910 [Spirosoma pollinicola]
MQRCLIIDDDSPHILINECEIEARRLGLSIEFVYFNPRKRVFLKQSDTDTRTVSINFDLVKDNLKETILDQRIDLIICDYSFGDKDLDGFKLLIWLRGQKKKSKLVLYSGHGEFESEFVKDNFSRTPAEIKKLIITNIEEIIPRDDRKGVIFRILKDEKFNLDSTLIHELFKYSDLTFHSTYPDFEGMSLGDIAKEIEAETAKGFYFKENLIQLAVSHMIDLNK